MENRIQGYRQKIKANMVFNVLQPSPPMVPALQSLITLHNALDANLMFVCKKNKIKGRKKKESLFDLLIRSADLEKALCGSFDATGACGESLTRCARDLNRPALGSLRWAG